MSPTLALMLIKNLPMESAFVADRRGGPEFRGWGEDRYLLANVQDAISILIYVTLMAHRGKGRKPPEPEKVWRPSDAVKKRVAAENNPFRKHLEAVKRRKAKAHG